MPVRFSLNVPCHLDGGFSQKYHEISPTYRTSATFSGMATAQDIAPSALGEDFASWSVTARIYTTSNSHNTNSDTFAVFYKITTTTTVKKWTVKVSAGISADAARSEAISKLPHLRSVKKVLNGLAETPAAPQRSSTRAPAPIDRLQIGSPAKGNMRWQHCERSRERSKRQRPNTEDSDKLDVACRKQRSS